MLDKERWNQWGLEGFSESEVNSACLHFESYFGVEARWNPAGTGCRLIRSIHARKGTLHKIEPPQSVAPFSADGRGALPIYWIDRDPASHAPYTHVQAYDKRASYLLAADTMLGVGSWEELQGESWEHYRTSQDWREGRYKIAGIWRLVFNDSDFPWVRQFVGARVWFYTPMVEALAALGAEFVVTEGYFYPQSSPVLKKWRELVSKTLDASEYYNLPALRKMIKAMYTQTFGLLGSDKFVNDSLYRPDWRGQIIDQSAARLLFNLATLREKLKSPVLAIYDDCLYIGSNLPLQHYTIFDPKFDGLMGGAQLAKHFRLKGAYELNDESRKYFSLAPAKFAMHIKQWEVK